MMTRFERKAWAMLVPLWICAAATAFAAPRLARPLTLSRVGGDTLKIEFALSEPTDVEVAILDAEGKVICHLAAGVLGAKTPPPAPLKPGLAQSLEWDGKDDYGMQATGGPFRIRVRAGMGVKLEKIAGGDAYAYRDLFLWHYGHAYWNITGLEAKSDGSVYVLGMVNGVGPPALRKYDADGNYQRTLFPPPGNLPVDKVKGWGVNVLKDGTYAPQYSPGTHAIITRTLLSRARLELACFLPCAAQDKLLLCSPEMSTLAIGTDGSLPVNAPKPLIKQPAVPFGYIRKGTHRRYSLKGPLSSCLSPDSKHLYLSGVGLCITLYGQPKEIVSKGFWREGRVWKIDLATGKAEAFYSMPEGEVITDFRARIASPIAADLQSYTSFHGITVDAEGRLFLCDRQHKRVLVLDEHGKAVRELPIEYPDAIALSPNSNALYVTVRVLNRRVGGKRLPAMLALVRYADWKTDDKPAETIVMKCPWNKQVTRGKSMVAAVESAGGVNVWVAYAGLPVRIYRDTGKGLTLWKDFNEGAQKCLDFQRIAVDGQTETVYVANPFGPLFRIRDWKSGIFEQCLAGPGKPVKASCIAIDSRNRHIYCRDAHRPYTQSNSWGPALRYSLDGGKYLPPANVGETGTNVITENILGVGWYIASGMTDRGLAAAPDGSLISVNDPRSGKGHHSAGTGGAITYFRSMPDRVPWKPLDLRFYGPFAGARFDTKGNLYVRIKHSPIGEVPEAFAGDEYFRRCVGTILKFAPTGSLSDGNLFPRPLSEPAKKYAIRYGAFDFPRPRLSRFGVDGYGRIYYPCTLEEKVGVMDNEGNRILCFGTYGNRDSMGGLPGDLVPTRDIPMAHPNSVDATDDYIYVGDIVNIRLLRLAKTFAAVQTVAIKRGAEQ